MVHRHGNEEGKQAGAMVVKLGTQQVCISTSCSARLQRNKDGFYTQKSHGQLERQIQPSAIGDAREV